MEDVKSARLHLSTVSLLFGAEDVLPQFRQFPVALLQLIGDYMAMNTTQYVCNHPHIHEPHITLVFWTWTGCKYSKGVKSKLTKPVSHDTRVGKTRC